MCWASRRRGLTISLLLVASCQDLARSDANEAPAALPPGSAVGEPPQPQPATSTGGTARAARRPARRHYFAREGTSCVLYTAEDGTRSAVTETPCPDESTLARGERIRLAGKICFRESPEHRAREVPVVCPSVLTALDKPPPSDAGP
ncbi:hypothetical protein [Chondromyces crocatus]|uniref:Secreted protein n=1 Tax=Chondromyces crocatus TaxID=52 RepID=A0A0K1EB30_CHOCO|nr:hypothetical protein [Chondromyces crocatus]AKT38060.1 uncharacterized protein CMC5_022010 [Chondromyces crocatus]